MAEITETSYGIDQPSINIWQFSGENPYRGCEVKLFHDTVVWVVLLGMVALIKNEKIDLLHLRQDRKFKIKSLGIFTKVAIRLWTSLMPNEYALRSLAFILGNMGLTPFSCCDE